MMLPDISLADSGTRMAIAVFAFAVLLGLAIALGAISFMES
jgi:hypothetical protein